MATQRPCDGFALMRQWQTDHPLGERGVAGGRSLARRNESCRPGSSAWGPLLDTTGPGERVDVCQERKRRFDLRGPEKIRLNAKKDGVWLLLAYDSVSGIGRRRGVVNKLSSSVIGGGYGAQRSPTSSSGS